MISSNTSTSDRDTYRFVMRFTGGKNDRELLSARLKELEGTDALIYADPTPAENWVYAHASSIDLVVNSVVMVITVAGSLAAIAQCIREFLKERSKRREELDRGILGMAFPKGERPPSDISEALSPPRSSILIKRNSIEIELTTELSENDILKILETVGKIMSREEALAWLQERNYILRKESIERELEPIEYAVPKYAGIVELFEKDLGQLKPQQLKRYKEYKTRLKRLQNEARRLTEELENLRVILTRK
mgnify:CR=1 FL=1